VRRATEQFGPIGQGWKYRCDYSTITSGNICFQFADLTIIWSDKADRWHEYGPVRGCNMLIDPKGRVDEDAPKKAMTDALTKALSHLGFSADVFMGMFDNQKYVDKLNKEIKQSVVDMSKVKEMTNDK
jgi:hypothetical protein